MQNMKLEWEYLFENIGTTKKVAVLKAEDGSTVLTVSEGSYSHCGEPNYEKYWKIEPITVFFGKEEFLVKQQYRKEFSSFSAEQLAQKKLICGCEIIEKDFLNQLSCQQIMRS